MIKKILTILMIAAMMSSIFAFAEEAEVSHPPVVILYTNDVHCGIEDNIGYAGVAAYEAAYDGRCDEWKNQLRDYLRENRDIAEARFAQMPGIKTPHNEGTYLLWLDCSALGTEDPADFFLKKAHIKVSSGKIYGYSRYVRFNYGCPRAQLEEALDRMEHAVEVWRALKK